MFKLENETILELNRVGRKKWQQPRITQLNLKETKGGQSQWTREIEWWFISTHS